MQSTRQRLSRRRRCVRWYPKQGDNEIIQRWADACSEIHNGCLGCPFMDDCEDLVDRLIQCMEVPSPGHRVTLDKEEPDLLDQDDE